MFRIPLWHGMLHMYAYNTQNILTENKYIHTAIPSALRGKVKLR